MNIAINALTLLLFLSAAVVNVETISAGTLPAPDFLPVDGEKVNFALNRNSDIMLYRKTADNEIYVDKISLSADKFHNETTYIATSDTADLCNVSCISRGICTIGWGQTIPENSQVVYRAFSFQFGDEDSELEQYPSYNQHQTIQPFSQCATSAATTLAANDGEGNTNALVYFSTNTMTIKPGSCSTTSWSSSEYNCPIVEPVQTQYISSSQPPMVGLMGETMDIIKTESDRNELCWFSPFSSQSACLLLPDDFVPPFYQPAFNSHMKSDTEYTAHAVLMNRKGFIVIRLTGSPLVNDIRIINQQAVSGALSLPVHALTSINITESDAIAGNVFAVFTMENSEQIRLHTIQVAMDSEELRHSATTGDLPFSALPDSLQPSLTTYGAESLIRLQYALEDKTAVFENRYGVTKFIEFLPSKIKNFPMTQSISREGEQGMVTLASNGEEIRLYEQQYESIADQPSHSASLNTGDGIGGLEVHIDHEFEETTRWTLAYMDEYHRPYAIINDNFYQETGCGVSLFDTSSPYPAKGASLNDSRIIGTSNHKLAHCIRSWLEGSPDEVVSLYLMHLDKDTWKETGRKFDLKKGGVWSTQDYLYEPTDADVIDTEYSSPHLTDFPSDRKGHRQLIVKSSAFQTYTTNHGLNPAQQTIIGITVPATLASALSCVIIISYYTYNRKNKKNYQSLNG